MTLMRSFKYYFYCSICYSSNLCGNPKVKVDLYFKAADWNLQQPQWTGRMKLVAKGKDCILKLEDKVTGELFAKCPIETYPGIAIEAVTDSSRYFVLRIQDDNGRSAFIGLGFSDRSDSFDLNVALQDHFKWLKKSEEIEKEKEEPKQELDLRFKEGETIKINISVTKKKDGNDSGSKSKIRSGGGSILPPPPGGIKLAPPPSGAGKVTPVASPVHAPPNAVTPPGGQNNPFTQGSSASSTNSNWVQF